MCMAKKSKLTAAFLAVATLGICLVCLLQWIATDSQFLAKSDLQSNAPVLFALWSAAVTKYSPARTIAYAGNAESSGAEAAAANGSLKWFNKCPPEAAKKPSLSVVKAGQMSCPIGDGTVYLYSAHYDDRQHALLLITDQLLDEHGPKHCQLWYSAYDDPYPAAASLHMSLPVGGNQAVRRNYVYSCTLPIDQALGEVPFAVGLVFGTSDPCSQLAAVAKVEHSIASAADTTEFGVCVSPFSKNFGDVVRLIEFVEINRMFGAQKFVFFNYSTSPILEPILRSYIAEGVADVIQFPLYPKAEQLLPYYAQVAAFHDCIYRYLNTVRFFAMLDLDEFIVPRIDAGAGSWSDLVHQAGGSVSYLNVRNTFYKLEWPDDGPYADGGNRSLAARRLPKLCTLQKVWRERLIWRHGERSKYIVRTRDVHQLIVHTAFMASGKEWQVPKEMALVQHYRDWGDKDTVADVREHKGVYDDYLLQYGETIVGRVQGRLKKLLTAAAPA